MQGNEPKLCCALRGEINEADTINAAFKGMVFLKKIF
jgi:hypothetical protein